MRAVACMVMGTASVAGLAVGCGGSDGAGTQERGETSTGSLSSSEVPLAIDARCDTDDYDMVGCGRGEGIAVATVLVDDDMSVRYLGSSIERFTTSDPVNTAGLRASLYLEVENTDDLPQTIRHPDPDDRFDGTFERSGSDLEDCGIVPRLGEIAPGQVITLRFCGSIATVGEIEPGTIDFDFSAPCLRCGGLFAVDERLADPSVVDSVAASVEILVAAGFGTAEELGIDDLDTGGDDAAAPVADEVEPSDDELPLPPPPPPPPPPPAPSTTSTTVSTTTSVSSTTTVVDPPDAGGVAAELGLVLASDGLGLVSFDQPLDQTMAALTGVFGEPEVSPTPIFQPGLGTLASATWGQLRVDFQGGNELFFVSYELARPIDVMDDDGAEEIELVSWAPSDVEASLRTTDGIGIGTTDVEAEAVRPTVYAPRCDQPPAETSLTENDGTIDQLFEGAEEVGSFLRRPIDGTIWSIGAQVRPNPFLCDGSTL